MICRDVNIISKDYFVYWNNNGRQDCLKIRASGADNRELASDLWDQIRDKIDGDKVMSVYCVG